MSDLESFFATCMAISVIVRICDTLPAAPSMEAEVNTESESITTMLAEADSIVAMIVSKSDSVRRSICESVMPSLLARLEICPMFSSHDM